MKKLLQFVIFALAALLVSPALQAQNPFDADMVVAADGSGDFTTLQAAIDAAPSNSDRRTVIYIKRGLYNTEKLIVTADKINLTLIGESREETILSYHTHNCSTDPTGLCPDGEYEKWSSDNVRTAATLTIMADGFRAENMTIQNTAGPVGQAQAITVRSDKVVFINVNFYGYQDTMYFWNAEKRSYFEGCLVVGRTDYIYGSGTTYFQSCEIRSWGGGWITAPSTYQTQQYGFVFNECQITYGTNSPGGSDGQLVRLGRPWHEYPKVAWLNCEMTEYIHPEGWGDKWNMDYADTSTDLHLYEYNNTGPGADMSGRANWAGLRELTAEEAAHYTPQEVLAGNDGWDPTADAPLVTTYKWTGAGSSSNWRDAGNWDPQAVPGTGEMAIVDSAFILVAAGDTFLADLSLNKHAVLDVAASSVATYISVAAATFSSSANVTLSSKIATKDSVFFNVAGTLTLDNNLSGIHPLIKTGEGTLVLDTDNGNFSGDIHIKEGTLSAPGTASLGKSSVKVASGSSLEISNPNAFYVKAQLRVVSGASLQLDTDVTLSQFFIDEAMQAIGEYSATSNPDLISGEGKIIIGRPDTLVFKRNNGGNWDVAENFIPALIPKTGETVIVEEEIETTSTVFEGDILLRKPGNLRMRGAHKSTGTVFMDEGTNFRYNTSGSGMSLEAPIVVLGDVEMIMESGNTSGSTLGLYGPISGSHTLTALNNGKGTENNGTLLLTGDNSGFTGTWNLTAYSSKYPGTTGYITLMEGTSENAFGKGKIVAGHNNRVVFSHSKVAGDSLDLTLNETAKAVLNAEIPLKSFKLNGSAMPDGEYSVSSHPDYFEGAGKIVVGSGGGGEPTEELVAFPGAEGYGRQATGGRGGRVIYVTNLEDNNSPGSLRYAINQSGPRLILFKVSGTIQLKSELKIANGDVTIAGQTAPGDGITLRDYPVSVNADNVIIRFMRFRMGDAAAQEGDALGGRFHKNIIVDHCSMSWSTDECVSFYVNENFTLQWCIVSESLRNSVHDKGSHGYGGIWGGKNASFHHNLLAHHDSRNPRLGESAGTTYALTDLVDLRNNVIYNWQGNSCYGGEGMNVNIVNCYYKAGPATSKKERIAALDKNKDENSDIYNIWGKFFIDGNVLTESERATNDNWTYGVYNQFHSSNGVVTEEERAAMRLSTPHDPGKITTHTAEEAYQRILDFCGASLATDSVDMRILLDVSTGTATYTDGGNGSKNGIVDTQDAVGGWPQLKSDPALEDTDEDGMPDDWENAKGLNPNSADDAQLKSVDGVYPNIEVYINSLVADIVEGQNEGGIMTDVNETDTRGYNTNDIEMYFNHGANELVISHQERISAVRVYSLTGQLMMIRDFNQNDVRLNLAGLKSGVYLVSVRDLKGEVQSKKLLKF